MKYTFMAYAAVLISTLFSYADADSLDQQFPSKVQMNMPIAARPFALTDVKLLDGPFKSAMERNAAWLKSLEPDRFLAWFRKEAGLEPKAEVYGGWESRGVAGQTLGHYLSACAIQYASTGDEEYKNRINYIVDELAVCQEADKNGYLSACPNGKEVFEAVAKGDIRTTGSHLNRNWSPWYVNHKVMAGLRDAFVYTQNQKALSVLINLADWTRNVTKNLTEEQWQTMLVCEYGGMNEVLADVYALTGDPNYMDVSMRFYDKSLMDPLSRKEDNLAGLHANTQVPKIIGAARIYELTGMEPFGTISEFFWDTVVGHYTFVNGGNSSKEKFCQPDKFAESLTDTTETCNTYNMLKLTRHLYARNPKPSYMDYYERALFNHILAHQHPETGMVMYKGFLDMPAKKKFSTPTDSFWCCVGTGFENHAKYGESIYAYGQDVLYINLFIASELTWKDKQITVRQETKFPEEDSVKLTFTCQNTATFPLKIRKPIWCETVTCVINGKAQEIFVDSSGYLVLNRGFANGDVVELKMPMKLAAEAMPDKPERVAFLYGPVVLAAELGDAPLPVLIGKPQEVLEKIKPVEGKPLEFIGQKVTAEAKDIRLIPLYKIADQGYTVYMDTVVPVTPKVEHPVAEPNKIQTADPNKVQAADPNSAPLQQP